MLLIHSREKTYFHSSLNPAGRYQVLTLGLHSIRVIITEMAEPLLILAPITEAYRGVSKMTIDPGAIALAIYTEVPSIVDKSEALPSVLIVMIEEVAITDIGAPFLLGHETQYAKLLPEFPASQPRTFPEDFEN
jgi:hypothetical protein